MLGEPAAPAAGEVHVWVARVDDASVSCDSLSAREAEESHRFRFEPDRRRFVASRAFRRRLLGRYLGVEPADVVYRYGPKGKPELAPELASDLSFNDSAADGLVAVAICRGRSVGVDIARLEAIPDASSIVSCFGSELEKEWFSTLAGEEAQRAFMRWWTGKEAFVKAIGEGLSMSLAAFSIVGRDGDLDLKAGPGGWSIQPLEPAQDYVGALVVEGPMPVVTVAACED